MFKLGPSTDGILAFRVSRDVAYAAVALASGHLNVYRVRELDECNNQFMQIYDEKGQFADLTKDGSVLPSRKFIIPEDHKNVLDIQIYKRQTQDAVSYLMYLVSDKGVLVFSAIDKRDDCYPVMDDFADFAPTGLTDLNKEGILLIDVVSRNQFKEGENLVNKYQIRKYSGREIVSCDQLDDKKEKVKFFRRDNQIVELKSLRGGQQQVSVYDFQNKLTVFWQTYPQVLFLEVEDDAIYLLTAGSGKGGIVSKQLHKMYEMEDNVKIQTLLKKSLFTEA